MNQLIFTPLPPPDWGEGGVPNDFERWPTKRLVVICTELSGDFLGGALFQALVQRQAELRLRIELGGLGGPALGRLGLHSVVPLDQVNYLGIGPVLMNLPKLLKIMGNLSTEITNQADQIDAVIGIDAQGFVARVMKAITGTGIKRIQLVAPTVWGRNPERAQKVAQHLDHLMCIYPFEPPLFEAHGLSTEFVGHPLVHDSVPGTPGQFRRKQGLDASTPLLAVLPGSRVAEVKALFPTFARAVQRLSAEMDGPCKVVIPVAPTVKALVQDLAPRLLPEALIVEGAENKWDLFHDADVALACTGTVMIELAMVKTPTVIGYRQDLLYTAMMAMRWKSYISIVNINAGREVHPEFGWHRCRSGVLADALQTLLNDCDARQRVARDQYKTILSMGIFDAKGALVPPAQRAATSLVRAMDWETMTNDGE